MKIEFYMIVVCLIIIECLGFAFYAQKSHIESLDARISQWENSYKELSKETKEYQMRIDRAHQEAINQIKKSQHESDRILAEKLTHDCSQAIQWAIDKSYAFV